MRIIGLGDIRWALVYVVGIPICQIAINGIAKQIPDEYPGNHICILNIFIGFSKILIGLLDFIRHFRNQRYTIPIYQSTQEQIITVQSFTRIENKSNHPRKLYFLYLSLLGIHNCICFLGKYITSTKINLWLNILIFFIQIGVLSFLCSFFLKYQYHKHHFFAFLIALVGFVFIVFGSFEQQWNGIYFILGIPITILFDSFEVYEKHLMDNYKCSPYRILLVEGVFYCLTSLGIVVIAGNISCNKIMTTLLLCYGKDHVVSLKIFTDVFSHEVLLYFLLFLIPRILMELCHMMIIFHFSPTHHIIGTILSFSISTTFLDNWSHGNYTTMILLIIGMIIIFFSSLLYNEIFIVYLCGIGENTRKEIETKGILEGKNVDNYMIPDHSLIEIND